MGVELPARSVPNQIRTIQPKLRREFNGTEIFTGAIVEDLVMIPTQSGEFELPPVKFSYFDPKKKAFETLEAKPPKISVTRGAGGLALTPPPAGATASAGQSEKKVGMSASGKKIKPLEYGLPGLPKEPLEGKGFGFGPLPVWLVVAQSLLPWAILIWVWWRWIKMRAAMTDPRLTQKDALKEWMDCIQKISNAKTKEEIVRPLILWQQAVFKLLGIKKAAPRATEIQKVEQNILSQESLNGLYKSYRTVEDALYGIETGVRIGDWCDETKRIAQEVKFPPQRWMGVLAPKNVWPWIGLWMVCVGSDLAAQNPTATPSTPADNPIGLYREGSFEKAEQIWAEAVRKNMSDPVSRNNLALAYYQIGDKERALAYGLSAYLLSPNTATVAWNTRIFAQGADQLDGAVLALWDDQGAAWLTSRFGVFGWQGILILGIATCALSAGLLLASGYFEKNSSILFRIGVVTLLAGLLGVGGGSSALGIYGKLADRDAAMIVDVEPLRSVPTEVEPQAEKAYPPGSIAHLEKSFLGWSKIRMPNQDVGWIRTEHLVPLY
jgi:tetratricopeptide (TPR) repeat protein